MRHDCFCSRADALAANGIPTEEASSKIGAHDRNATNAIVGSATRRTAPASPGIAKPGGRWMTKTMVREMHPFRATLVPSDPGEMPVVRGRRESSAASGRAWLWVMSFVAGGSRCCSPCRALKAGGPAVAVA